MIEIWGKNEESGIPVHPGLTLKMATLNFPEWQPLLHPNFDGYPDPIFEGTRVYLWSTQGNSIFFFIKMTTNMTKDEIKVVRKDVSGK